MATITQGRVIPDTDRERVAAELREKFDLDVAPDVLAALFEAITKRKTGWIRPHIRVTDGRITGFQLQTDFSKDLDGRRGD